MSTSDLTADQLDFVHRLRRACTAGTYYEVLRVDQSAPTAEIKRRYDELARTWHPDRFHRLDDRELRSIIEENFAGVNEAFAILRDERKRAAYDRTLKERGIVPPREAPASAAEPDKPVAHVITMDRKGGKVIIESTEPSSSLLSAATAKPVRREAPRQIKRIKDQIAQQLARARGYFDAATLDAKEGAWARAESNFYLATRYDSRNAQYQVAYEEAKRHAQAARSATFMSQGDQAASYSRHKEAIAAYQKAAECDPSLAAAWFKLGQMLLTAEDDQRGAVDAWRKAVLKEPRNVAYRIALAELYQKLDLRQNAMREARAILEIEPKQAGATAILKQLKG
jgi:curved DNA-binding protein CbpA